MSCSFVNGTVVRSTIAAEEQRAVLADSITTDRNAAAGLSAAIASSTRIIKGFNIFKIV